ncbi:MAG: pyruvate:ferredoxin (flavodoxin) oxidoreductase [Chloroflexi bacterium]|nr:pyruvate:ferredoxin (flavodoxin) oxidoreductase [Chloroflexota bacterium]
MITIDANEAAAMVAHKVNEVIAIYPITPASPMGEWSDQWSAEGRPNLWGHVPTVIEMQSEAGAAGAVHGALQSGALTTTFTASQGLLLMIPNLYKIAGELTPTVLHIAARSLAAQGLSIFGDHSDVMAARQTGFALLAANSVQEAMDFALISSAATLRARIPFLHFFDGFRTSHEVNKIDPISDEVMRAMMSDELIRAHRTRGLMPDNPFIRGTAQNPDVYFQARESVNQFYTACPVVVQETMDQFAALTGRQYKLFDYVGAADADRVIIVMGSGAETAEQTALYLNAHGHKVGVLKVRLYRPLDTATLIAALPATTKAIAVLDRTKEPGAGGEPLYLDVVSAVVDHWQGKLPALIGGRYGLSSKEFTPGMVKAIYDELAKENPKKRFTIGINDDVTHLSLAYDPHLDIESADVIRAMFYGLGADGTVGANKNAIKIIGEDTDLHAQGYFVYDSKKSGAITVSHLRFGPQPIHAPYLILEGTASFVACHQFGFLEKYDMLKMAKPGATFLLNSPYGADEVWNHLPRPVQEDLLAKQIKFYVIDALQVAQENKLGNRINTTMQTCFFALSGVLPREEAITAIKYAIQKTYGKRGEAVVAQNYAAVDSALGHLHEVTVPMAVTSVYERPAAVSAQAPDFVRSVTARMIEGMGDMLPVSAMPIDGTYPCGTTQWEKRNIATEIPVWDPDICIQCGKCAMVCPHSVIRMKLVDEALLADAPETFKNAKSRYKGHEEQKFVLQVAPEDCTGCTLCVEVCPVKNKRQPKFKAINMAAQAPLRDTERNNWEFFQTLPEVDRTTLNVSQIKESQLLQPLFEFSGACAGCGETPYLSLLSRLFGDRMMVANATGCSSIYGGNLPTTPWTANADGRGPSWSNSLFEDNAEFGFGMRAALDQRLLMASELLNQLRDHLPADLVAAIENADQSTEAGLAAQRERVAVLKEYLTELSRGAEEQGSRGDKAAHLLSVADVLVKKSVWIIGGDGWAYDIGYGGLDHVLASGKNVNILVLDTEVYSNTGGQMSKATPRGAVAKFAAGGKTQRKKDLGLLAMSYGNVYVAKIAFGAKDTQTIKALLEAEAYDGPSLIIAYSHCVAHGYDLQFGLQQQAAAVDSGHWPLFRYHPEAAEGENPFTLDSKAPSIPLEQYIYREGRYRMLQQSDPHAAETLLELAKDDIKTRWAQLEALSRKS